MAALDQSSLEFARTLAYEDIPTKLRCATCNRLAIDAVKLPCCDQAICGECLQVPREQCPVCEHSPFAASDCKPHKSLRMTIKAFVKNEEKKREKEAAIPILGGNGVSTPSAEEIKPSIENGPQVSSAVPDSMDSDMGAVVSDEKTALSAQKQMPEDIPLAPFANFHPEETIDSGQDRVTADGKEDHEEEEEDDDDEDDVVITTERSGQDGDQNKDAQRSFNAGHEQNPQMSNNEQMASFDENQQDLNNNFGGMNGFNPMMAMQNGMGMPGFAMGMPNMMGMPGMNMDPSMMFGGNFGPMGGMNDMNMNMGMMSMGMGMGMGMGMNGFGGMPGMNMNGPNFFPGQGGYNNSNFGPNVHQNFRNDRGFGGRPYGRGFGRGRGFNNFGRGRGGGFHQNQSYGPDQGYNEYAQNGHQDGVIDQGDGNNQSHQPRLRGSPSYEPMNAGVGDLSDPSKVTNGEDQSDEQAHAERGENDDHGASHENSVRRGTEDASGDVDAFGQGPINNIEHDPTDAAHSAHRNADENGYQTHRFMQSEVASGMTGEQDYNGHQNTQHYGFQPGRGRGGFRAGRGGFRGGRGAFAVNGHSSAIEATELTSSTPAPPVNAPTGPKAMREGKPNSGWYSRPQAQPYVTSSVATLQTESPSKLDEPNAKQDRDDRRRSRSLTLSPARQSSRKQRPKSPEDGHESDETYYRRKEKERRRRKDRERGREEDSVDRRERSDEESRNDDEAPRRYREKDGESRSSRSHRERSRERRRRRHRSASPGRNEEEVSMNDNDNDDFSRRRNCRHQDDYEEDYSRKSSNRTEPSNKYDSKSRSSHRATKDKARDRRQEEEYVASVVEQPPDDFKIKGSRSGNTSALPPPTEPSSSRQKNRDRDRERDRDRDRHHDRARDTKRRDRSPPANSRDTTKSSADPYAEERERRHAERVLKEQQRRQSSNPSSLGKRSSRDDGGADDLDGVNVPRGPRGDGRRNRKERRMNVRYEGEVDDDSGDRDAERWR